MSQMLLAGIVGLLGLVAGFGIGTVDTNHRMNEMSERGDGYEQPAVEMSAESMMDDELLETPLAVDFVSTRPSVASLPSETISAAELAGLLYMREEEKLARDVYTTLYERWNLNIFNNIAQSEQTHTEAVRDLLEKYDIADPVVDDSTGVFADQTLQALYDTLVAKGLQSEVDALMVGAAIEELDMKDIVVQIGLTDNDDVQLVYNNLLRGSRNHLRSFTAQLENRGVTYKPEYISETEYQSIITSERETGMGQGRGWGGGWR